MDTPGILWPKFEDQKVGLRLALIGSIRDEILNTDELAVELIRFLKTQYPGILTERYEVEETQKETELLCGIAENRKCITKGGELDYSKAAGIDRGLWDLQNKAERQNDILVKYRHMSVPPES